MIKSVAKDKEAYVLQLGTNGDPNALSALNPFMRFAANQMGKSQFLYMPFTIFNSESDQRFMDMLLKRKGLLTEETK